jgi:CBS domain-containing protein
MINGAPSEAHGGTTLQLDSRPYSMMKAFNVMSSNVVSVGPDVPINQIARVLVEKGISAVPVLDESGDPIGMVSEGDLVPRSDVEREARRHWWLHLLAEGEALNPEFLADFRAVDHKAKDVMSCPVITITPDTDVAEIAELLAAHRIERVPVVQDRRVVGIVSRADLLRGLAEHPGFKSTASPKGSLDDAIKSLDSFFLAARKPKAAAPCVPIRNPEPPVKNLEATDFRRAVEQFEQQESEKRIEFSRAQAEQVRHQVSELLAQHVSGEQWHDLLRRAHKAAEQGEKEFLLLRFPSQLCSDGGRMINVPDPNWPASLRGQAAEIFLRWERDLKPYGFVLSAQILDFPNGIPGDAGLTLVWGK